MSSSTALSVKGVRDVLPLASRDRSLSLGVLYFAASAGLYWMTFALMAISPGWGLRVLAAVLNGLAIGVLFIVGHDACHGSLTPSSALNTWLGRMAFLPSLHPFAAWEYSHNALHHGWTNLKGKDPVYCPMTLDEYRLLSPGRRRLERAFRSWAGMLPLYLLEIWWPLEIHPSAEHRPHIDKRGTFGFDRALVFAFLLLQIVVLAAIAHTSDHQHKVVGVILCGVLIPFLTFNWLIGFATFQHHTHPRVVWYDNTSEWNFFRAQVQGTVHIVFPRWIELLLHNIMEHTAHHVDTRIPLYRLTSAQDAVEAAFGEENVISEQFSFAGMARTFRTCQLYDFEQHQWLSFDGTPTTEPRRLNAEIVR
jgi:omega-6 fatty acid desaturase (delta-12 desaturase)